MGERTKIEWTRGADGSPGATWTPIRARNKATGKVGWHCEHASPGCLHCYSESLNRDRLGTRLPFKPGNRANVEVFLDEVMLLQPLRWTKPRMIFVCSMTDLFADFVPDGWIDRVFAVMASCPQHVFQVLTKRSARMRAYCANPSTPGRIARVCVDLWISKIVDAPDMDNRGRWPVESIGSAEDPDDIVLRAWPLPNCWKGVSAEDQRRADERVPDLLATPAVVRFVSAEPLLSGIEFRWALASPIKIASGFLARGHFAPGLETLRRLDWVIVGGESGPNARPMHPTWARDIRDQCAAAGVAFYFKQHGAWAPVDLDGPCSTRDWMIVDRDGGVDIPDDRTPDETVGEVAMRCVGKARAGRLLDDVEHNAMPEAR